MTPETQLDAFIGKFEAKDQRLIRAVRRAVRRRFAGAWELVYDNYNFFVIGYSPTERPSDAIVSITARAGSVGLCFIRGAALPDPGKLLQGSGHQTRFIRLDSAGVLARPEVEALISSAIARARAPLPSLGRGRLIIRSISAKQRPRRKAIKTVTSSSKQKRDSAGAEVRRYIASQPAKQRGAMRVLRSAIRATAPKAVEHFSYGIPGFRLNDRPLVWYAAFKQHVSLYPVTAAIRRPLADDMKGYKTSTGTIRFPFDEPLPVALVKKIVRARAREAKG